MKRILIFLTAFFFIFSFSACKENKVEENREAVVINLPKDDSVNGYRTGNSNFLDNTVISADSVGIDNSEGKNYSSKTESSNSKGKGGYCLNTNSKIYHKVSCSSVSGMKEENKSYFSDKTEAINRGYKPCQRCNP